MKNIIRIGLFGLLFSVTQIFAGSLNIVHEWGTFTSVMGSDGRKMEGLYVEEEKLPGFVYSYDRPMKKAVAHIPSAIPDPIPWPVPQNPNPSPSPYPPRSSPPSPNPCHKTKIGCRSFEQLGLLTAIDDFLPRNPVQEGVTQKMETPVIYFYGDEGTEVKVQVDFPQGIISQWFPRAASFSPTPQELRKLGPSQFIFDLKLLGENVPVNQLTAPDSIWNPARAVSANTIDIAGEYEKFIFYRGVGDFDGALSVTSDYENLTINNQYGQQANMILLNYDGVKGEVINLGKRGEVSKIKIPSMSAALDHQTYLNKAKKVVVAALIETGLFPDEAIALANTWEKSYFLTPGLRLLSLMPQDQVERILPLKIIPTPKELVRVLVARLEIITKSEEQTVVQELLKYLGKPNFQSHVVAQYLESRFGRFTLPKGLRIIELINDEDQMLTSEVKALADSQLREVLKQFH